MSATSRAKGRRNPFANELFVPGIQDTSAEDLMVYRPHERSPVALLVANRAFPEFGAAAYGYGVLDRFFVEVSRRYVRVRRIGRGSMPTRHASEGSLFLPPQNAREVKDP